MSTTTSCKTIEVFTWLICFLKGVLDVVKGDHLIHIFGNHQILKKGELTWTESNHLRNKLRFLGRLLIAVRKESGTLLSFSELLSPRFYDNFVAATLVLRGKSKQLAVTLGHYLKQICMLNIAEGIKSGNKKLREDSELFLQLYNSSWSATVASSTIREQQKEKLNKPESLPVPEDLLKLTSYVQQQIEGELLKSTVDYTRLQKMVLASLVLFNKRRPAEVADMKVSDYTLSLDRQDDRKDVLSSFSFDEQISAAR